MARRNVSTAEVRAWGRENLSLIQDEGQACLGPTARGRLHPTVRAAFTKAHKSLGYAEKVAEARTETVPVPSENKNGVISLRQRQVDASEARAVGVFAGVAKGKGRLSAEAKSVIGAAYFGAL